MTLLKALKGLVDNLQVVSTAGGNQWILCFPDSEKAALAYDAGHRAIKEAEDETCIVSCDSSCPCYVAGAEERR